MSDHRSFFAELKRRNVLRAAVLYAGAVWALVQYLLMFISMIALRRREPQLPRPYRAWCYPWTTAAGLLITLAFLGGVGMADRLHSWTALGILVASYPLYRGVSMLRRNAGTSEVTR